MGINFIFLGLLLTTGDGKGPEKGWERKGRNGMRWGKVRKGFKEIGKGEKTEGWRETRKKAWK